MLTSFIGNSKFENDIHRVFALKENLKLYILIVGRKRKSRQKEIQREKEQK